MKNCLLHATTYIVKFVSRIVHGRYLTSLVKLLAHHLTSRRCILFALVTICVVAFATIQGNVFGILRLPNEHFSTAKTNGSVINIDEKQKEFGHSSSLDDKKQSTPVSQKQKRFPECIVIGAKKCGTFAIGKYLSLHPDIEVCFEPHFFSNDSNFRRGMEYYRQQMPATYPHQITIEKTPKYFLSERATKRIQKFNPNIKLILTLRHPVRRMISDYWHTKRALDGEQSYSGSPTFEELAFNKVTGEVDMTYEPVNVSMYYVHLKRYLDYFPKDQIHVVDGDNLIVNPYEEIEKVETFVGVEHRLTPDTFYLNRTKGFYCVSKYGRYGCLNADKGHKHPDIHPAVYQKLMAFFAPLNEKLFNLLGRRFNWN